MKPCKHETYTEGCHVCKLYKRDARYRKLWDAGGGQPSEPGKKSLPVLPCEYGDTLTVGEIRAMKKNPNKVWKRCDHPQLPLGRDIVCTCTGCGPGCDGYKAEGADNGMGVLRDDGAGTTGGLAAEDSVQPP